jgi:hypothetical protein
MRCLEMACRYPELGERGWRFAWRIAKLSNFKVKSLQISKQPPLRDIIASELRQTWSGNPNYRINSRNERSRQLGKAFIQQLSKTPTVKLDFSEYAMRCVPTVVHKLSCDYELRDTIQFVLRPVFENKCLISLSIMNFS